jgi:hypothetical protein
MSLEGYDEEINRTLVILFCYFELFQSWVTCGSAVTGLAGFPVARLFRDCVSCGGHERDWEGPK